MNNPYSHPRFKRLKRHSKVRYAWALLRQFPRYLLWQVSRLIPDEMGMKLRRRFGFLAVPYQSVSAFIQLWFQTRHWKKLWFTAPLLVLLGWLFTTLFLANNQSDDELYGEYRTSLLRAVGQGDYELADFLTGKLLMNPAYEKDEQVLYAAMIAANETGNIPRRDLLLKRLTVDLKYVPAHLWYAQQLLSKRGAGASNLQKAIQHVNAARDLSDDPEDIGAQLAQLYFLAQRPQQALRVLEEAPAPNPKTLLMLARIYFALDEKQKANEVASKLLNDLEVEDPEMSKFLQERITALTVLGESHGDRERILRGLLDLVATLENRAVLAPDDQEIRWHLSQSYLLIARNYLKNEDEGSRRKAMEYFEKVVAGGKIPPVMGMAIVEASNLDSGGGMTENQMRDALVRGNGVAVAHLFLGLDAWKKDLMKDVVFHFKLAYGLEPHTLRVVEKVAIYIASASSEGTLNPFRLSFDREPLWRRAIRLLDCASEVDKSVFERNLYTKCAILMNRQRWGEIPGVVEPHIKKFSNEYRERFYEVLIRAYAENQDYLMVEKYKKALASERANEKGD